MTEQTSAPSQTATTLSSIRDGRIDAQRPADAFPHTRRPLTPATVTEALQDLLTRQEAIKRDLDVLISDATTLRTQM